MDIETARQILALPITALTDQWQFRRDAYITPAPGTIIAEFGNAHDAMRFLEIKGLGYTVTAGINMPFAVRVSERLPHGDSL